MPEGQSAEGERDREHLGAGGPSRTASPSRRYRGTSGHLEIDLGGRTVQLWHFGPGNGPGDTLVYVPDARVCWTGNFLGRAGIAPMLLIGDPIGYLASLRAMRDTLDVERLVPGHGFMADAGPAIDGCWATWSG